MKNKTTRLVVLTSLIVNQSLFSGGIIFENPSTDREVLNVLEKKVSNNYNNMFIFDEYKRINGYWKDKLNGRYTVEYKCQTNSKIEQLKNKKRCDLKLKPSLVLN